MLTQQQKLTMSLYERSSSKIPIRIRLKRATKNVDPPRCEIVEDDSEIDGRSYVHTAVQSDVQECCSDSAQTSLPSMCEERTVPYEDKRKEISCDPLHSEFLYYCALLKEFAPLLTEDIDRRKIIMWIKKLFRPEYHTALFKDKRNR